MQRLIRSRLAPVSGSVGKWAYASGVRSGAGFDAPRIFDGVAIDLWPSKHLAIHVYEIKVSRSDLRRELNDPLKTQAALDVADHFWLAAPAHVVDGVWLPPNWGILTAETPQGPLRVKRSSPRLTPPVTPENQGGSDVQRGFVVGMIHSNIRKLTHADRVGCRCRGCVYQPAQRKDTP